MKAGSMGFISDKGPGIAPESHWEPRLRHIYNPADGIPSSENSRNIKGVPNGVTRAIQTANSKKSHTSTGS